MGSPEPQTPPFSTHKAYQARRESLAAAKTLIAGTKLPILEVVHRAGRLRYLVLVLNSLTLARIHVELDGEEILGLTPDQIISDGAGKLSIGTGVANSGLLYCHRNTSGAYGITLNLKELPEEFNDSLRVYLESVGATDETLQSVFCLYDLKT